MRQFLERNSTGTGVALVTVLMILITVLFYRQDQEIAETKRSIVHTYEVTGQIQQLLDSAKDMESSQRGYIITGNPTFLEAYRFATGNGGSSEYHTASLSQQLNLLRTLVSDNPSQQKRLDLLRRMLEEKLAFMQETIHTRDTEGPEAAMQRVSSVRGKEIMDDITRLGSDMIAHEDELLTERIRRYEESRNRGRIIMFGSLLGCYMGLLCAIWLITRQWETRRRAEAALRQHHHLLQDIMDASWNGIITTDADGIITQFNRGAERLLGCRQADAVGSPLTRFHSPAEMLAYARALADRQTDYCPIGFHALVAELSAGQERRALIHEWLYHDANGREFPVSLTLTAISEEDGTVTGYLATVQDITQQKEVERMKNEFISTVSHELRTPLTSIRGSLGLVVGGMAGTLPEKASDLLNIAHKNSERLIRLINDILDIEKIEAGKMRFDLAVYDLSQLLEQAQEAMEGYAERFGVAIDLLPVPENLRVRVDADRFQQLLSNLLSNAVKFSPQGSAVVIGAEADEDRVRIRVTDAGPGIDEAFRDRIFQKFAQADSSDTRAKGGTGLGLSISRAIAEKMGGSLTFESETGAGTTFYITLPLVAEASMPALQLMQSGINVLICEDDPDVAKLLSLLIEQEGYRTDICRTLAEAREKIETQEYAAITLDLLLPDGSGVEFIRQLRERNQTRDLPIVVVSAKAEDGRKELNGNAHGIVDWLVKPIDTVRLMEAIRRAIHTRHNGRPQILHVEDDPDIVQVLRTGLEPVADLIAAQTLKEAEAKLKEHDFSLIILDISLPDGSGLELLSRLHQLVSAPVPVLILSASDLSETDHRQVITSLVKSRVSEDHILSVIRSFIQPPRESPHD